MNRIFSICMMFYTVYLNAQNPCANGYQIKILVFDKSDGLPVKSAIVSSEIVGGQPKNVDSDGAVLYRCIPSSGNGKHLFHIAASGHQPEDVYLTVSKDETFIIKLMQDQKKTTIFNWETEIQKIIASHSGRRQKINQLSDLVLNLPNDVTPPDFALNYLSGYYCPQIEKDDRSLNKNQRGWIMGTSLWTIGSACIVFGIHGYNDAKSKYKDYSTHKNPGDKTVYAKNTREDLYNIANTKHKSSIGEMGAGLACFTIGSIFLINRIFWVKPLRNAKNALGDKGKMIYCQSYFLSNNGPANLSIAVNF